MVCNLTPSQPAPSIGLTRQPLPMIPLIRSKYALYKQMAEDAIEQVSERDLARTLGPEENSIAVLAWCESVARNSACSMPLCAR
jgi:hypothetical protein